MTDQLDAEELEFATNGFCGDVAAEIADRTGWQPVILTGDGQAWTHAAVRTDTGYIIDAIASSCGGEHILDNDIYYDAFEADELGDDGEVWFEDRPGEVLRSDDRTEAQRARAADIAARIVRRTLAAGEGSTVIARPAQSSARSAREQGRVGRGVPAGGQFAGVDRAEAAVRLG